MTGGNFENRDGGCVDEFTPTLWLHDVRQKKWVIRVNSFYLSAAPTQTITMFVNIISLFMPRC